jgi:hypothetical protein
MDYFQFTKRLLFNRGVGVDWKVGREEALWVDLKVEQAFEVDRYKTYLTRLRYS